MKSPIHRTMRSTRRCNPTSAAAAVISAFSRRSGWRPERGREMRNVRLHHHALIENVSRRNLLKGIVATGGLVVAAQFLPRSAMADGGSVNAYKTGADGMPGGTVYDPHVFVSIAPDGTVTIVTHRAEMGTGTRTSLPMIVADEMEADWSRVKIAQAPGNEKMYGNQDTDGSRSIRHFIQPMRACGAATRQMLEHAAALSWGVPDSECRAKNHQVIHVPSGKSLGYGQLAAAASAL